MGFRTIAITKRSKLSYSMGMLEIRGESLLKVYIDDIDTLLIEDQAVSLSTALLTELVKKKVKVIFCDDKRNPISELVPLYGSRDSSRKLKLQIAWRNEVKLEVWDKIVRWKIYQQYLFLTELKKEREHCLLREYLDEMTLGDTTNREGLAAKVYFNALFGMGFNRNEDSATNAALNYGYALLLSTVNKEIVYNGYSTQLGLFHDNIYNPFNLASDIMEPFRILVDRFVLKEGFTVFETDEKHKLLHLLEQEVIIDCQKQILPNAIRIYVRSVFEALCEENPERILFYYL